MKTDEWFVPEQDDRALADLTREREEWERDEVARTEYERWLDNVEAQEATNASNSTVCESSARGQEARHHQDAERGHVFFRSGQILV